MQPSSGFGYAMHMRDALPGTSFIGFTGTPIEKADANTQETFGGYVWTYDIEDAKEDKATVPIYYESRLAKLVGPKERVEEIAADLVEHYETRTNVLEGKAMVVMSRVICVSISDGIGLPGTDAFISSFPHGCTWIPRDVPPVSPIPFGRGDKIHSRHPGCDRTNHGN